MPSLKCIGALSIVMPIWLFMKLTFPPDGYYAPVFVRSALHFFDATIFETDLSLLVFGALTTYLLAFILLWRRTQSKAWLYASLIVTIELAVYWVWFDQGLHATNRYYMRTALVIVAPVLGVLAVAKRSDAERWRLPFEVPRLMGFINADKGRGAIRTVFGMFCVITLVYAVETIKFVVAWSDYKTAVRALAMGTNIRSKAWRFAFCFLDLDRRKPQKAILELDNPVPVGAHGARICSSKARGGSGIKLFLVILRNSRKEPRRRPRRFQGRPRACAYLCMSASLIIND